MITSQLSLKLAPSWAFQSIFRSVVSILVALSLTACGELISNPRVVEADNNQVVTIGDSIFALSGEIQDFLEDYAGETFRRYTISGAELSGGALATSIVDQYGIAWADNPAIETIVMDGGGNDILIPAIAFDPYGCKTTWYRPSISSRCRELIEDIYVESVDFLNEMAEDGVQNVIYLGYYYTKDGLFRVDSMGAAVDYGDQKLAQACAYSTANCTFVDPRTAIRDSDIIFDGIHPSTSGSRKLADLIWPHLQPLL